MLLMVVFVLGWTLGLAQSDKPSIYNLNIVSNIRNRYAKTSIISRVANPANSSQEVVFSVVLPDSAFISSFVIEVDGKKYDARVAEKEEARKEYQKAKQTGQSAGHVELSSRDANVVSVSVNVERMSKIGFNLTYEELLSRELGAYNHRINLKPGQLVDNLSVEVTIDEPSGISLIEVPNIQESNEINDVTYTANPLAVINRTSPTFASITWAPTKEQQHEIAADGVKGLLNIRYDVVRQEKPERIWVSSDGYFVHFFSPAGLRVIKKHVIFVLDISGSMSGRKIEQLKTAMNTILDELNPKDSFTLIPFSSTIQTWIPGVQLHYNFPFRMEKQDIQFNSSCIVPVSKENINLAKESVNTFVADGGTYLYNAVSTGIKVAEMVRSMTLASNNVTEEPSEAMILLLTDGEPNGEVSETSDIIRLISRENSDSKISIFSLAFGEGADYKFLQKLSLKNNGFARKIYEASDAALQLRNFYRKIASPVLSNVKFSYDDEKVDNSSLTRQSFNALFSGSELVISGRLKDTQFPSNIFAQVKALDSVNSTSFEPEVGSVPFSLERLWAYLTIKQLLDLYTINKNATTKNEAVQLALTYSFVTPVTSLVVVKPNETQSLNPRPAGASDSASSDSRSFLRLGAPMSGHRSGMFRSSAFGALSGPPGLPSYDLADRSNIMSLPGQMQNRIKPPARVIYQLKDLTWLNQFRNGSEVTFTIHNKAVKYLLGSDATTNATHASCTTPRNETGTCTHLRSCVQAAFISDVNVFFNYMCHDNTRYIEVCCPNGHQRMKRTNIYKTKVKYF